MRSLINDRQVTITKTNDILREQREFYKNLYTTDQTIQFKMATESPQKVPVDLRTALDSELTIDELAVALRSMKRHKSPGPDGLPADFYKVFFF